MIEDLMKAVKSGNKKRGRNITVGAVAGFLLSCTSVMGTDEYLWIKNDGGAIKFNTAITTDDDGAGGNWSEENPYSENTWDAITKTYTNNTALLSSTNNGKESYGIDISYGLRLSGDLSELKFINNGSIIGIGTDAGYNIGYGIWNSDDIETVSNIGLIVGIGTENQSGYGIWNSLDGDITNLINNGLIIGMSEKNWSAAGASNTGTITTWINNNLISGAGIATANGISTNGGLMSAIINNGLITGTSVKSKGSGISNFYATMTTVINNGSITGTGKNASYGINNVGIIENISNIGSIIGRG